MSSLSWLVFLEIAFLGVWFINAEQILLDDQWLFEPGSNMTVNLPHTVVDLSFRYWNPESWETTWHYRKMFDLPKHSHETRFFLIFDGILTSATITLNGVLLGEQIGGYIPFRYEATEYIKAKTNVLDVMVNGTYDQDVPPEWYPSGNANSTDFYQPAGIYRSVHLLVVPKIFISDVFAKPVNVLDPSNRSVQVACTIDVPPQLTVDYTIVLELLNDHDHMISTRSFSGSLNSSGIVNGSITQNLSSIKLWSLYSPNLYHLRASLWIQGKKTYDYRVRFGFREAIFTKTGFYLNGQRIQLFGLARHQWYPYFGGAMGPRGQARDVRILKKFVNIVRQSHYPQSPAFLDACDELGMLVWIETPGWGFLATTEQYLKFILRDVGAMIERDRNHPSVIIYGVRLNETPNNATLWGQTQNLSKILDDSRQTTGAMVNWLCNTTDFQQDVFSCNDYDTRMVNGQLQPWLYPPRKDYPYLVSESIGAMSGFDHYYRRWDNVSVQQNQAIAHAIVHNRAASDSAYCGLIAWCGIDYPSGFGYSSENTKTIGMLDVFRVPKLGASLYRAQVSKEVVIEPSFYWSFEGIFSVFLLGNGSLIWANADVLKIFVDGKPFATLFPSTDDNYNYLQYPPFVADFTSVNAEHLLDLWINAYVAGKFVGSRIFSSNTSLDRFSIDADDTELHADGSDATRVVLKVVDAYGNLRPSTVGEVQLQLIGDAATLIGDNPFPIGSTGGDGAVWIRSAGVGITGGVVLVATHQFLGTADVEIHFKL